MLIELTNAERLMLLGMVNEKKRIIDKSGRFTLSTFERVYALLDKLRINNSNTTATPNNHN